MVERITSPACLGCDGYCCHKISVQIEPGKRLRELLEVHYGRPVEMMRFKLLHSCPHLTDEGLCDIWHEDPEQDKRPDLCKTYTCEKMENPGLLIVPVAQVADFEK